MQNTGAVFAVNSAAESRARLIKIISEKSLLNDTDVKLSSGVVSSFYFDMKPTIFDPEGINLIAELILDELRAVKAEFIGGLEMGAVPVVACVVQRSLGGRSLSGFFVRKQPKEHGMKRLVEGLGPDVDLDRKNVVLVDDVTTTGGSVLKAVEAAREEGAIVRTVVTVVDRGEGAVQNLAREEIELRAILTRDDFEI